MTALAEDGLRRRRFALGAMARRAPAWRLGLMVGAATGLALLLFAPLVVYVWHGGFGDPDDAMRLVEVRAWMGGQSWFDMTAWRLDPPAGASMHWSRLVDIPNVVLIRLFGMFVDPPRAEALDRIVLPVLWLAGLYLGMARLATILLGRPARGTAILGTLLSGATLVQFQPGRIGHHAPETVALVFAVGAALASLDPRRAREAAIAGGLIALSLAMSLETMPLLATLCVVMVLAWIWRGAEQARALAWFGAGLGSGMLVLFLATVPPVRWTAPTTDAFGILHLAVGLAGAAGVAALAGASRHLPTIAHRLCASGLLAIIVLASIGLGAPALFRSPFTGVDPLVRAVWLDHVVESKPLFAILRSTPMLALAVAIPAVLGSAMILVAAARCHGVARHRFAALAVLAIAGVAVGLWQLRAFASVTPLALAGGLFAVVRLRAWLDAKKLSLLAVAAPLAIVPFTSTGWALILPVDPAPATNGAVSCLAPEALAPLATLAPGRAVAPLDSGSHILEATRLDVFAAPYHRNNDGNRFVLDVWGASSDQAKTLLNDRKVTYVLSCPGMGDFESRAATKPDGLAARLKAGAAPAFLEPVATADTPYRVFRVRHP